MDNMSHARRAYSGLEATAGVRAIESSDYSHYFSLLADNVVLKFGIPAGTPIGGGFSGKDAVIHFFTTTAPELFENVQLEGPLEFLGSQDRVVVLGRESYTIRKTGVRARSKAFAIVLDFQDGLIIRDHEIKEMTEFVDGWRIN